MQDPTNMNQNDAPQAPAAPQDEQGQEGSPIDGIISTVDQLMANPASVTPETLGQLRMDLEDLKTVLDGEPSPSEEQMPEPNGGLVAMIGGGR